MAQNYERRGTVKETKIEEAVRTYQQSKERPNMGITQGKYTKEKDATFMCI